MCAVAIAMTNRGVPAGKPSLVAWAALVPEQAGDLPERSDYENSDAEVHRDRCGRHQQPNSDGRGIGDDGGRELAPYC
jgi:hypothetical protein